MPPKIRQTSQRTRQLLITTIFPRIYARMYYAHPRARVMSFSLCAAHDCRFALGQVFADEGGGHAHVNLKILSGISSGTKVVGAARLAATIY